MTLPRTCPKCGKKNLTEDDFPLRSDGRRRKYCKSCYNEYRANRRARKEKRCSHCLQWKSVSDFFKDVSRADGYQPYCKECANEMEIADHSGHVAMITALHTNGRDCPKCGDELILDDDEQSVWCRKCGFRHYKCQNVDLDDLKNECRKYNIPHHYNKIGMRVCSKCGKEFEGSIARIICSDCNTSQKKINNNRYLKSKEVAV